MKHYVSILMPLCVAGLVVLGIVALNKDGVVVLRFGEGKVMIDGR